MGISTILNFCSFLYVASSSQVSFAVLLDFFAHFDRGERFMSSWRWRSRVNTNLDNFLPHIAVPGWRCHRGIQQLMLQNTSNKDDDVKVQTATSVMWNAVPQTFKIDKLRHSETPTRNTFMTVIDTREHRTKPAAHKVIASINCECI